MGITLSMTGAFRETGASFFFIPKGALTHHLQSRRWYSSLRSGRALFTKHPPDASPEGAANAAEPAGFGRHCLCGWQTAVASFASSLQIVVPALGQPATRLRKPATGSFIAEMDDAIPHRPFSFVCAKRNKNAPCGEQKGRDPLWRSIIWKLRS